MGARAGAEHRAWPAPARPWALAMRWHDLLFMHWPVRPEVLRPLIPPALELQTFDGTAWLGVVPFHMTGVRPRGIPSLAWPPVPRNAGGTVPSRISRVLEYASWRALAFPELNVRTYVTMGGKPGVWFFSLDAANPLAVRAARWAFHLPYYDARMTAKRTGDTVRYASRRTHRGARAAEFAARYRPTGPPAMAPRERGTDRHGGSGDACLERWLTDRYCLYAADRRGTVWRGEIDHAPWPLQPAEAEVLRSTMTAPLGLALPDVPPLLHFAEYLEVVAWSLELAHPRG